MKNRLLAVTLTIALLVLLVALAGHAQASPTTSPGNPSLVYVDLSHPDDLSRFASTQLPMYAYLEQGLLAGADQAGQQDLRSAGLRIQVLDEIVQSGTYYLAETRPTRPAPDFTLYGKVLLSTSTGSLLRMDPSQVDALTAAGAELKAISLTPKPLPALQARPSFPDVVEPDPLIQGMIDQVTETQVYTYDRQLAGELPVWVDGDWYTILTRYTYSGVPIQKATHFVGQHMQALGLDVDFHVWDNDTNPNVIGEISGLVNPDDIFIIGGHLDAVQGAPGADDNASGSVATMLAADIFSQYQWGCTMRFAFWTGEEQGLLGSADYAEYVHSLGENIVGYLNLDMIAWNTIGSEPDIDLIYNQNMPSTLELANLYADVVEAYNIPLVPEILTSLGGGSDHSSFWDQGYTSILAIEDQGDFNPYYHSPQDTPAHTDPIYFTNFVKASIATTAHMSGCLIPTGTGALDGHVTAADGGAPIEGAKVVASDGQGHNYPANTDDTGYYTRTLIAGTYDLTASAYSYLPATISGVIITTDTVTTQDFSLLSAPTYLVTGTISESGTGLPLLAEVKFDFSPVTVWSDPATGLYQAELPAGNYTMQVRSDLHRPQQRDIVVDQNQVQDFSLEPLPCILLVDDDKDSPDVQSYYTSALDGLGVDYDVWDTSGGDPTLDDIAGYRKLLWFTGEDWSDTLNAGNETMVAAYLDSGGNFFLSSQDYLFDMGLTSFGQNYLHINNFNNDVNQTTVTGQNVFDDLGPYNLSYPFYNYSDIVNPDAHALVAFSGNQGNAAISYDGDNFNTAFFGYPFEAISQLADREAVMNRLLDFFGECQPSYGWLDGHVTDAQTGDPLQGALVTATPGLAGVSAITDPSGYYTMTLPVGDYSVTASMDGYLPQSQPAPVVKDEITTRDFALEIACEPVSDVDFTWQPLEPFSGEVITFTATASGSLPIDFQWDFGDTYTDTGETVTHIYPAGSHMVSLTASNGCGAGNASHDVLVLPVLQELYLPLVRR